MRKGIKLEQREVNRSLVLELSAGRQKERASSLLLRFDGSRTAEHLSCRFSLSLSLALPLSASKPPLFFFLPSLNLVLFLFLHFLLFLRFLIFPHFLVFHFFFSDLFCLLLSSFQLPVPCQSQRQLTGFQVLYSVSLASAFLSLNDVSVVSKESFSVEAQGAT